MSESKQNGIGTLLKYWPVILFIAGLIMTWTNFKNQTSANEDRLTKLEARAIAWDNNQNEILVQLSQIQADLAWIKNKYK